MVSQSNVSNMACHGVVANFFCVFTVIKHATPPPPLPQHVSTGGIAPEMDIPQSRESVFQLGGLSRAPGPSISRNLRLVAPDGEFYLFQIISNKFNEALSGPNPTASPSHANMVLR